MVRKTSWMDLFATILALHSVGRLLMLSSYVAIQNILSDESMIAVGASQPLSAVSCSHMPGHTFSKFETASAERAGKWESILRLNRRLDGHIVTSPDREALRSTFTLASGHVAVMSFAAYWWQCQHCC